MILVEYPTPGTQVPCRATGGVITYTHSGYIHTGGQRYSGSAAEKESVDKD